ncbi:Protein-tyrosine phosphatase receptor IA-2 ectodomain [Trinorchestia longiramus]|nr:Protein-tyrosine phosphatase receptor IA-2 ectodomain [Trinorchestia longiramus]
MLPKNFTNTTRTELGGCLFSNTLCENEWCFDDYAFGRCFPTKANLKKDDLTRYHLDEDELHVLEAEMQRLYHLGYRWSHTYTQCVLQALLQAIHESTEFDVTSCNDELDQDLEGALRAIEGEEQEAVSPRDLAIVRFTPSATDPHSDYADEFYFPAIEGGKLLPAPYRELPPLDGDKLPQSDLNNSAAVKTGQSKSQKISNDVLFNENPNSSPKSKEKSHDLKTALKTAQGGQNIKVAKPFYSGKADRHGMKASVGNIVSSALKFGDTRKVSFNSPPYSGNYFDVNPIDKQLLSGVNFQKSNRYDYNGMQRDEFLRNKIYPKNPYSVNTALFGPQGKEYLVDPGYSVDGFMSDGMYPENGFMGDQPILDDTLEEPEMDFMQRSLNSKFPTKPLQMSNKEYLKQHLNFPVRDYNDYEDVGYDPSYDKSLYGGRSKSLNPLYRKRSSKSQRFNLRNFLNEFNEYVKVEREKTKHSKKDMRSRTAANTSNVASDDALFPGHIDPELRKDFMSFAEDVMKKDRYGDVKPQYNTAELKKLAAIIDELRTIQQGPHDNKPLPRALDRSDLQPVYANSLSQRGKATAAAESSQNEIADYYPDTNNGAYLRVDKAIPYGSPSRYPVHPRPHIDRYSYAPYTDDLKQPEETYLGTQDTAGGEQGYYHQGQVPPTDLYYKGQQPETFYPAYGPAYDYHRNSIDSQIPDTPVPLDEDPYDTYKDGFGSQTKYPFFYLPEGPIYDYPMYDYATTMDGATPSASDDPDSANFVKKDEETADSEYGTIMGAEGKPLPYNFERPERVDVKKPGPNYYTNHYAFHDTPPLYYYDPNYDLGPFVGGGKMYDNYPPYGYLYNDPYPNYDMEDVDTVGGADSGEGALEGNYPNDAGDLKGDQRVRYRDANGNAIDIGLATGRGGMIPMVQDSESAGARFSQLLRQQGLKGSTLHPGTDLDRFMRMRHPAHLPDLLLTEEMVVDNVSRGLANQHHAKMMNRPHGMHPGRMNMHMDMGEGRLNQSSTDGESVTHAASLPPPSPTYVYVDVNMSFSSLGEASDLASLILHNAGLSRADIQDLRVEDNRMLFTLRDNLKGVSEQDIADKAQELAPSIQRDWNVLITRAGVASSQVCALVLVPWSLSPGPCPLVLVPWSLSPGPCLLVLVPWSLSPNPSPLALI